MTARVLGFVVVQFNAAGGTPSLDRNIHPDSDSAREWLRELADSSQWVGHRDTYEVFKLARLEEDE